MDFETWRSKFVKSFRDSLMELKTINSEIEEADSPPSQSYFERLRDSLLSVVESINFEIGDCDSIFGGLRNSLLSALETISEVDSPRSPERLQLCRCFQYLDAELIRKRNYGLPPSHLRVLDRLPHPSQTNKLYLYFWHSYGRITYTLYEIKLPNPLYYPPTKATQDAEIRNPSWLRPILELETSKYPDGMCCVQLSSGLYFFGGKFNIDKPFIGEDEKAKFMNGTRNVLPRDVYVFNFTLYNWPYSLRRLNKDMLFQIAPMKNGKASPQAFVVCGKASEQIYVIGSKIQGLDDKDFAYFEFYDASVDRWRVLPNPPHLFMYNTFTWVGNAVVGRDVFLVGTGKIVGSEADQGWSYVCCFDLDQQRWRDDKVLNCLYLPNFSGKFEFVKNSLYGCYHNTVVRVRTIVDEFREEEEEEEEEEGGEEDDEFQKAARLLRNYKCLRMVSKEKGMDAIYNVPRQLQSSSTLLHLGRGYFCYVRTGKPPPQIHVDEVDDDDIPSNRDRFTSIVIFQTASRETYEEIIARFFRAQFVYSKHYAFYSRFGEEDVFIKGCYALGPSEPLG